MKTAIRTQLLAKRKALNTKDVAFKSKQICDKLQPLLSGNVAIYHAIHNEVDLSYLKKDNKINLFALPSIINKKMLFYEYNSNSILRRGQFAIPEVVDGKIITDFSYIIVPILAFHQQKYRIGYGSGYYDQYLKKFKGSMIGVAYAFQEVSQPFFEPHDIAMHKIINECKTIE